MGLKVTVDALWDAATSALRAALSQQPGVQFYEWSMYQARRVQKGIVVLDRVVRLEDAATKLIAGELSVLFGSMVQSSDPKQGKNAAEGLAYWLAELYLADPSLGGKARNVRIEALDLDYAPPEPIAEARREATTQHWVSVNVVWEFTFSRP